MDDLGGHMNHPDPSDTWTEWLNDEALHTTDDEKLTALREIIVETARTWMRSGEITPHWANKKLAKLGIADRFTDLTSYGISVDVTGTMEMTFRANSRADALAMFEERISTGTIVSAPLSNVAVTGTPQFMFGPEDPDPDPVANPDVPTTVDGTLVMLREILMLGNIAGPRFSCETGVNRVLASFGLAPLPPRREFAVHRPVQGVAVTVVEAYDQASAERIAGWRWQNDRVGHSLAEATVTGDPTVTEQS